MLIRATRIKLKAPKFDTRDAIGIRQPKSYITWMAQSPDSRNPDKREMVKMEH